MFKRRNRQNFFTKSREFIWPDMGFRRACFYWFLRIARLRATPHAIACGFAWGAAFSFTPLFGLHVLLAIACTYLTRGNPIAGAIGTIAGNPISFLLIGPLCIGTGTWILGDHTELPALTAFFDILSEFASHSQFASFLFGGILDAIADNFFAYFIGGLIWMPPVWLACYFTLLRVIPIYMERRRRRRQRRMEARKLSATRLSGPHSGPHTSGSHEKLR